MSIGEKVHTSECGTVMEGRWGWIKTRPEHSSSTALKMLTGCVHVLGRAPLIKNTIENILIIKKIFSKLQEPPMKQITKDEFWL